MNYKRCQYFVEGPCEKQLIKALEMEPRLLTPGHVIVHNVIQDKLPRRVVNMIKPKTTVVFVFDTDVEKTDVLQKNIEYVSTYAAQVKLVNMVQVLNFEDEMARATDVKKAQEITKSSSVRDFKTDFCKMKVEDCRHLLRRHHLDASVLWSKNPPAAFSFVKQGAEEIKLSK